MLNLQMFKISLFSRNLLLTISGGLIGLGIGLIFISVVPDNSLKQLDIKVANKVIRITNKQIIGFLPYWLTDKAATSYSKYLTTLTFFSLTIGPDGKILKLINPQEEEPGWNSLKIGKLDTFFNQAKTDKIKLSLLVFSGNSDSIGKLINNPANNADNLVNEVAPIMQKYGFSDLNLDIENIKESSSSSQLQFAQFVKEVRKDLNNQQLGSLTIELSPDDLINRKLININLISDYVDNIVIMAYDYHYSGSFVSGPIAPLLGANIISEYDTSSAINQIPKDILASKIILGIPLYGYEWQTLNNSPRSAIIPNTGSIASNLRVEKFLATCNSCQSQYDTVAQESYIIYKDDNNNFYHQIFYPNSQSMHSKINFTNNLQLGGIALWALGYEGNSILEPVSEYKNFTN